MGAEAGATLPAEWRAAPPSPLYYATCLLPAAQRQHALALWQHKALLDDIPFTCSDPGVAAAKLAWWQQEFARASAGEARHPLCRIWNGDRRLAEALSAIAGGLLARGRHPAASAEEEVERVTAQVGPLAMWLGSAPHETPQLTQLLVEWQLAEELLRVGEAARARHPIWPHTLLRQAAAFDLYTRTRTEALSAALAALPRPARRRHAAPVCLARGSQFALASLGQPANELADGRPQPGPGTWLWLSVKGRLLG